MTSLSCSIHLTVKSPSYSNPTSSKLHLLNGFVGLPKTLNGSTFRPNKLAQHGPNNGGRAKCWFKFGKNGVDAEGAGIYGSQSRNDFDRDDVEQYFNYMGMLAVEGTYDKMEALLKENIHPVDILLLMAASEGDKPKIEELLRAGANYDIKDAEGRTALDRANDEIREYILNFTAQKA